MWYQYSFPRAKCMPDSGPGSSYERSHFFFTQSKSSRTLLRPLFHRWGCWGRELSNLYRVTQQVSRRAWIWSQQLDPRVLFSTAMVLNQTINEALWDHREDLWGFCLWASRMCSKKSWCLAQPGRVGAPELDKYVRRLLLLMTVDDKYHKAICSHLEMHHIL